MCGIAGFFSAKPVSSAVPASMLQALLRRGPDGQGRQFWDAHFEPLAEDAPRQPFNALLHTRLAIRDPRPLADQPMASADGKIWLCYNGEVYGWENDVEILERRGAQFKTRSDTEFILHAYEAWGLEGLIERLRGMFALAIVDLRVRKVFLLRDRLGLKPLLYYCEDDALAFGSTVRSVLPFVPRAKHDFSSEAIDAFLAHRYIPAPRTIYRHIQRLENGHFLSFDLNSRTLRKQRYWEPQAQSGDWRASLDDSIRLRTASDRPVGMFLSSGVDSSLIASRLAAQSYTNISTYSAAFPHSSFDESAEAAQFAEQLGMQNLCIPISFDVAQDFARMVEDLDEPFADPSSIPTWYLAKETVKHVTVALGGDGGDELFAGYKRYRQHLRSRFRRHMRLPMTAYADWRSKSWKNLAEEARISWEAAYALRFSGFTPVQRRFLQPDIATAPTHYWRSPDQDCRSLDPIRKLLGWDYANFLPEYVLRKADLCTMAHGLELRAPLLDHIFFQHVLAMPDEQRFTQPAKATLATFAQNIAPCVTRKKKGFNPPLKNWLHRDLLPLQHGLGTHLHALSNGQLHAEAVDHLVNAYQHGEEALAEQILQLMILAESLRQLHQLTGSFATHGQ